MGKFLKQVLFLVPIAAIVIAPVVLHFKNTSAEREAGLHAVDDDHSVQTSSSMKLPDISGEKQDYSMPEPFASNDVFGVTYSMQKSMDPNTWMKMLTSMINPHGVSPEAMCALCHREKEVARYQKQFGPIMEPTWNQYKAMMDPHVMGSMMNPAMMTQMMHQMVAMPMQMMAPMMNSGAGTSGMLPNVMSPDQYKEWYNKQREGRNQRK